MSLVYLLGLIGVTAAVLGVLFEAVMSVSRKPEWRVRQPSLRVVETEDRRRQNLPFVGKDRRKAAVDARVEDERRAA